MKDLQKFNFSLSSLPWKPLELRDRGIIEDALKQNPIPLSDYSFTNLWMWNRFRSYQVLLMDSFICLKFYQEGEETHLYPIGKGSRMPLIAKLIAMEKEKRGKFTMRAIPENEALDYSLKEEPHHFDYIYLFDDLLHLSGNRYQSKRNLIYQFTEEYDFEYHKISLELLPQIKEMETRWFSEHKEKENSVEKEHQAALDALNDYFQLNAQGGALMANGKLIAYSFAERLTNEMLVIHVEKALTEFKGSYQMMNQQLLMHLDPVRFVNREEDLGISNLRKIKNSYHPVRLEKKYTFTISDASTHID